MGVLKLSVGVNECGGQDQLAVLKARDLQNYLLMCVVLWQLWRDYRVLRVQKEQYGLSNPFAAMSVLTPVMAAISLVLSFSFEPWGKLGDSRFFDSPRHVLISFAIMFLGGSLAFFMVSTEFVLLSETSAVTLTVAGIVKELVTVLVAVLFLNDQFTPLKGFGLGVIIIGVSLYNLYKYRKLRERRQDDRESSDDLSGRPQYVPLQDTTGIFELGDEADEDIP